ncbi:MAG: hypothetical protein F4X56_02760 [Gammaproteobacteria bacterium]|nr:hypothetical protein [Gammaproteobacteria bacterium]MYC24823.1 hypothetical protein [Gammaproteobacteria bacterium]
MNAILASVVAITKKVFQSEWIKYVFELFVVFLGVYLAFLFTDYQEDLRERRLQVQYYEYLSIELQILASTLDFEEQKLQAHLQVVKEIEQGKRPRIPSSDLLFVYPGFVRDAAFYTKHFESLEYDFDEIILGTHGLAILEKEIESFNEKSNALLPTLANPDECCYAEDGSLLDHWRWYPRLVERIHLLNRTASEGILNRAIPDLKENIRRVKKLPLSDSTTIQTN